MRPVSVRSTYTSQADTLQLGDGSMDVLDIGHERPDATFLGLECCCKLSVVAHT